VETSAVRFSLEQRFAAPVEAVEAAFLDPDLLGRLSDLPHLGHAAELERSDDGRTVRRRVRWAFTAPLSPAVTAVIDRDRLTWVEESVLDRRTHQADFVILPDHYPDRLRCEGTVSLWGLAGTTRRVTEGTLDVRFALVGRKVEQAIVAGLRDHAAAEEKVVQHWLDEKDRGLDRGTSL
jgi:hypothetical protein